MFDPLSAGAQFARGANWLAVYGTLRPDTPIPSAFAVEARRARAVLEPLRPCVIPGRLVDLGAYPAATPGDGRIVGVLCRVRRASAWPILDAFEECDVRNRGTSMFTRERLRLIAPAVTAWVYLWAGAHGPGPRLPGGDWARRPVGRTWRRRIW